MTTPEPGAAKKANHFNDNCQNCVRQRIENESFIKIYQKLQKISERTSSVKHKVNQHQLSSSTNRSFYNTFEHNVGSLPKNKKEINSELLENAGFELAIGILQRDHKKKLIEQNDRLKKMINQMRSQKWQQKQAGDSLDLMKSSCFTEKNRFLPVSNSLDRTYNSCQTPKAKLSQTQTLQNMLLSNDSQQAYEQNTTQSSSFKPAMRNSMDLSRYNDLNLWLYQSQKNTQLEEQLYKSKKDDGKMPIGKMTKRGLSTLRKK